MSAQLNTPTPTSTIAEEWEYLLSIVDIPDDQLTIAKRSFYSGMFAGSLSVKTLIEENEADNLKLLELAKARVSEGLMFIFGDAAKEIEEKVAAK